MAKSAKPRARHKSIRNANATTSLESNTLSSLEEDANLWYKLRVLIYDLRNMDKDRMSEQRTLGTTDELYISAPYFTSVEASRIKATTVVVEPVDDDDPSSIEAYRTEEQTDPMLPDVAPVSTVEEAHQSGWQTSWRSARPAATSVPAGLTIWRRYTCVSLACKRPTSRTSGS
jgi:hypothetical protein